MRLRAPLLVVAACAVVVALFVRFDSEPPPRTIGMDPRVETPTRPLASAVGETAGGALYVDAYNWRMLAVVAYLEAAEEARRYDETPRLGGARSSSGRCGADMACRRQCEAGGNYSTNTGNGYYGAYQFSRSTWESVGGTGLPSDASPAEQDARAQALYDQRGGAPWPNC